MSDSDQNLTRYAWLSIAAALVTICLKSAAFALTGSVGLLSDAIESSVNLVAAALALWALWLAARPADDSHPFGHGKAEYFSAGVEGVMIFLAAAAVVASAIPRFTHPEPLDHVGVGLAVSAVAGAINFAVATVLLRAGRRERSITLTADAKHLLTDVWTSGGVLVGVALVQVTGWERLDPLVAILVAINILWTGSHLVRASAAGLMDAALPAADRAAVESVLDEFRSDTVQFHALRTRAAGRLRFVTLHVLVPGAWDVHRGHELAEGIESRIAAVLPGVTVETHLEPIEDSSSYDDITVGPARWSGRPEKRP